MGGKGGGGKSTLMTSLVDFFHAENCPVTLIDCDTENKVHGSFSHFFKEALKVDITTPSGFDEFVEKVLCDNAPMVLATLERDPENSRSSGLMTCTTHCKRPACAFWPSGSSPAK